jgi:urease accessory protein
MHRQPNQGPLQLLRLLQLADSALPIGAMAHSFGLEQLVAEGLLDVSGLEAFLGAYLEETGALEGACVREAHELGRGWHRERWENLNRRLSALKPARESREASAALGRRLLELAAGLGNGRALLEARTAEGEAHHCASFGLVGGALGFHAGATVIAYLHQSLAGLISACQRLMPLGQRQAARMLWDLKPAVVRAAETAIESASAFTPLLEAGSMRHPWLATRLFIS